MSNKKPTFIFTLDRAGKDKRLRPDSIPARKLVALILEIDTALSALVKDQWGQDYGGISIKSITRGSLNITGTGEKPYERAFEKFGSFVNDDTDEHIPRKVRQSVRQAVTKVKEFNHAQDTVLKLKREKKSDPIAVIEQCAPVTNEIQGVPISGITDLYGWISGISGTEKISIKLKLTSGESVEFPIPQDKAKWFGSCYNDLVGVRGDTTWDASSGKVTGFSFQEILRFEDTSPFIAFNSLREAYHEIFDSIEDVDALITELRED